MGSLPSINNPFPKPLLHPQPNQKQIMGSVVSAIGGVIGTIISAIATVLMTIVGAIVTVIVLIFDVILDILCCRWCSGGRRAGTYRHGRGRGATSGF